jgi:hypothetical protein
VAILADSIQFDRECLAAQYLRIYTSTQYIDHIDLFRHTHSPFDIEGQPAKTRHKLE